MVRSEEVGYTTFMEGVKACVPTILGYFGIGIAVGVVGKNLGLSTLVIVGLSVIVYGGSSQFVISAMLVAGSPISAIVLTTFFINFRHFLMSFTVAPYFKTLTHTQSVIIGSLVTDESYGVFTTAALQQKKISYEWMNGLNITAYLVWVLSSLVGALLGDIIPNPESLGLDYALTAMFIGLVVLQLDVPMKTRKKQTIIVLMSVIVSYYVLSHLVSGELAVIIAALFGCLIGVKTNATRN